MTYPLIPSSFDQAPTLLIPDPDQVRPVYEAMLARDPETPFPYWARIWPSAKALTNFLLSEPGFVSGKNVLEIGAGIGMPSFAIAQLAREVTISDHAPEAITLVEKNIERLELKNVKARCLDWNHFPDGIPCDVVLMSDVNYSPDQFENLLALLMRLLEKGCGLVIATPQRITATVFVQAIQPFVQRTLHQPINEKGSVTDISILVLAS